MANPLIIETPGRGLVDVTGRVRALVRSCRVDEGVAVVFLHHTSASLLIGENADPDVPVDTVGWFDRLVTDGDRHFTHTAEGPDDMSAHIRSILTGVSLSIPVRGGDLDLGTWQGIFVFEHRYRPHRRRVSVTVIAGVSG